MSRIPTLCLLTVLAIAAVAAHRAGWPFLGEALAVYLAWCLGDIRGYYVGVKDGREIQYLASGAPRTSRLWNNATQPRRSGP